MTTYVIKIDGRVQGVGYRVFAQREALAAGLCGTVRNMADGSVEIVAQCPADAIQDFIARLRQGPHGAHVNNLAIEERETSIMCRSFEVRPSA